MATLTASQSDNLRSKFRNDAAQACKPLNLAGLTDEVPVLTVLSSFVEKYNNDVLPWTCFDHFKDDCISILSTSGFYHLASKITTKSDFCETMDKHLSKFGFRPVDTFSWSNLKSEFDKKNLIRQTDSLIRDLVKAIGNDNNRLTDVHLICAIVGKLHVGGDETNIWKEAAKAHTKRSFVKFFKDLLDHSGRVHNASYTDLDDLIKVIDWQLDNHPTLHGGKQKWGSSELSW